MDSVMVSVAAASWHEYTTVLKIVKHQVGHRFDSRQLVFLSFLAVTASVALSHVRTKTISHTWPITCDFAVMHGRNGLAKQSIAWHSLYWRTLIDASHWSSFRHHLCLIKGPHFRRSNISSFAHWHPFFLVVMSFLLEVLPLFSSQWHVNQLSIPPHLFAVDTQTALCHHQLTVLMFHVLFLSFDASAFWQNTLIWSHWKQFCRASQCPLGRTSALCDYPLVRLSSY